MWLAEVRGEHRGECAGGCLRIKSILLKHDLVPTGRTLNSRRWGLPARVRVLAGALANVHSVGGTDFVPAESPTLDFSCMSASPLPVCWSRRDSFTIDNQ